MLTDVRFDRIAAQAQEEMKKRLTTTSAKSAKPLAGWLFKILALYAQGTVSIIKKQLFNTQEEQK